MPPEVLHESTGLRIIRNPSNQFVVVTLHHTANPAKRSQEWRREEAAGLTPEQFAREYDIDYTAIMGAKVFPEINNFKSDIVIDPIELDLEGKFWGGFDYGSRNPASFHVYTYDDGVLYSCWELYEPCKDINSYVQKMRNCPYFNKIRYIAADPSMWAKDQHDTVGGLISVQDLFYRAGVKCMIPGKRDEIAWVAQVRQAWLNPSDITFKIFNTCPNQIKEFETAIYSQQSDRQLLTAVYKESIADVNNHSLDDCKYLMLSRPPSKPAEVYDSDTIVDRWAIPRGRRKPITHAGRKPVGGYI